MGLYLKAADGVAPSTFQIDMAAVFDQPGPFWIAFDYWVHTVDLSATGVFSADLNWLDRTGQARVINGLPIGMYDSTGHNNNIAVNMIERQSGASAWTFDGLFAGTAGTSLISYRIMHFPTQTVISW